MANFNGKWQIDRSTGFEEYMAAIGVKEEKRADAIRFLGDGSKMTYEIITDGTDWTFKVTTPVGEKEIKFTLGSKFKTFTLDEREIQATFTMDGDKLVEEQEGTGFTTKNVRTVSGDTLTMVMTGNDATCTRHYKRV